MDRTATYLDEARKRGAEEDLQVEFLQEDMRTFVRPGAFDAVINYFTSFGYFESDEDERRVLANAHRSLRPSGVLLIEMMGKGDPSSRLQRTRLAGRRGNAHPGGQKACA